MASKMTSKTAPIDKLDIYVSAQNLYKKIYNLEGLNYVARTPCLALRSSLSKDTRQIRSNLFYVGKHNTQQLEGLKRRN